MFNESESPQSNQYHEIQLLMFKTRKWFGLFRR